MNKRQLEVEKAKLREEKKLLKELKKIYEDAAKEVEQKIRISNGKINLIDFFGCIPNNLDFIISEEYAKRLDRLFICWNNGNKKTKQMEFIDFLYDNFYNKLKINNNNCIINIRDKILLLVDIQNIQIIEFRFNYYNIDISHYNSLKEAIDKIQNKINELNIK